MLYQQKPDVNCSSCEEVLPSICIVDTDHTRRVRNHRRNPLVQFMLLGSLHHPAHGSHSVEGATLMAASYWQIK